MPPRPIFDKPMTAAERQRRRRRRLGIDGPTVRFARAVQNALKHGLPEDKLLAMVVTGAERFREHGPVTETALARRMSDARPVTPTGDTAVRPISTAAPREPETRDSQSVTVASPSVARDDQEAIRQRLRDRLGDRMGSTGMAGLAREIDVGAQVLKNFLAGGTVYAKTLSRIEAYLGR
jgi:hypothetical protein